MCGDSISSYRRSYIELSLRSIWEGQETHVLASIYLRTAESFSRPVRWLFRTFPMKILLSFLVLAIASTAGHASDDRVYELRIYTAEPARINDLVTRLKAARQLFAKHGMTNIVFFEPIKDKDSGQDKMIYLLGHKSREAAAASWKAFGDDPAWHALRDANEAHGKVVTKVDSTFLVPTDYSPPVSAGTVKPGGVYELRTYTTAEGKLGDLDARFRNHTLKLFEKHGMTNGAYFHPTDADKGAANTLIYWVTHESPEAATASWSAFRADPVWVKARTESEKNGKLTTEVKSIFLTPLQLSSVK
jgi:hypothetical protein